MESLSPECTPLKHRYDSCFNSWFEGYLQPALDSQQAARSQPDTHETSTPRSTAPMTPQAITGVPEPLATAGPSQPAQRRRIITNWSSAFPDRRRAAEVGRPASVLDVVFGETSSDVDERPHEPSPPRGVIDTKGKTRTQIKAEEYERNCGSAWRAYQGCLKNAIEQNPSLSALLEQARVEHPLKEKTGLEGTVWDASYTPKDAK